MNTAVIDDPSNTEANAWWFLDALVIEHRRAPGMQSVVLEMMLPVGHAPALHVHDDIDDTWYVIDGQMALRCGDNEYVAEPGMWVSLPRGVPHAFRVVGDRPARILVVHDNRSFLEFVAEIGEPPDQRVPPPNPKFPSIEELGRVAHAHDLAPVGPPMNEEQAHAIIARVLDQRIPA